MLPLSRLRVAGTALLGAVLVGPPLAAQSGNCRLFASDASSGNLLSYNARTLSSAVLGNSGISLPSLAVDPTSGLLYAGEGQGQSNLHILDPVTGAATLVGGTGLGFATVSGLEFAADGTLYACLNILGNGGTGSDHLGTIDKTTGVATVIGPFGTCAASCTIEGLEGLSFDDQGVLYAVKSVRGAAGAPGLYTIDPATGQATFDKPLVDSTGASPSGGFVSLQYCDCDGVWYAGTAKALGGASDGGMLAEVDIATGVFTYLTTSSLTTGSSLGGLARLHSAAVSTVRNGTGVNPLWYSEVTPAIIGQSWQLSIDLAPSGGFGSVVAAVGTGPLSFPSSWGEVLIDITGPLAGTDVATGMHSIPIAPACGLIGFTLYTQGVVIGPGGILLTNAIDATFGSF